MKTLGIRQLTSKEIEELCSIAEEAARTYILSIIPPKKIETLNVSAEAEGNKPVTLDIDVAITLSTSMKEIDAQKLVDKAVEEAFTSAEKYLREKACHLQK